MAEGPKLKTLATQWCHGEEAAVRRLAEMLEDATGRFDMDARSRYALAFLLTAPRPSVPSTYKEERARDEGAAVMAGIIALGTWAAERDRVHRIARVVERHRGTFDDAEPDETSCSHWVLKNKTEGTYRMWRDGHGGVPFRKLAVKFDTKEEALRSKYDHCCPETWTLFRVTRR